MIRLKYKIKIFQDSKKYKGSNNKSERDILREFTKNYLVILKVKELNCW